MTDAGWRAHATGGDQGGRLPGAGWIIGTSCWLIPVLFFGGYGAWLGFLIIGCLLLRTSWLVFAGIYAVWAIIAASLPDDQARLIGIASLQVVSIIHGMIANRRLLITIWGRLERNEQWWGRGAPPARGGGRRAAQRPPTYHRRPDVEVPREAESLLSAPGTDRADYFADPAPAPLPPPRGTRRSGAPPAPVTPAVVDAAPASAAPVATVDVNAATVDEFRTLPGITKKRAEEAVAARDRRTRFASVQEFADDLGLQPHELARIRDRLTCSRPRRKSFGRKVDL
jgi:hypothetical protein